MEIIYFDEIHEPNSWYNIDTISNGTDFQLKPSVATAETDMTNVSTKKTTKHTKTVAQNGGKHLSKDDIRHTYNGFIAMFLDSICGLAIYLCERRTKQKSGLYPFH